MAGDVNAISLHEYAIESNQPFVQAVVKSIYESDNLLTDIPMANTDTLYQRGIREIGGYPVPTWTDMNAPTSSFNYSPEQYTEQAYITRDNVDIDKYLVKDKNQIGGPGAMRARRVNAYITGWAFEFNYRLVNNSHTDDGTNRFNARCFVGLRERIDNPIYKVNAEMKIDFGGVDLTAAGMTKASANTFVKKVQQLIQYTGAGKDGQGCSLYMNDFLIRSFEAALRLMGTDGGWGFVQDPYGKEITAFKKAKIRDVGRVAPLQDGTQTTRIITATENANGTDGASTYTSMYICRYGDGLFHGWQFAPLAPMDLGLINDGVTYRTVFDYAMGLWMEHTRSIGRGFDIKIDNT